MKNLTKNLAITLFAAGTMLLSSAFLNKTEASYAYRSPEANGIEQKVDKEHGKAKKIRAIEVSGKVGEYIVEDTAVEITYEDGTIVTTYGCYGTKKVIERTVGGKKIIEKYEKNSKEGWEITDRTLQYEKDGAKITESFWRGETIGLEIHNTSVKKPTKDGKIVEWYWGNNYLQGKNPDATDHITETVIYPKGTKRSESKEYCYNQNEGLKKEFFEEKSYDSIERKLIEYKTESGKVVRRTFETILTDFDGMTEKRIEQDYEPFKTPLCDGKIDFRLSIAQRPYGTCEKIDYNGDGIPDEEIYKRVSTIFLD